jgi:amidohydrolase
MFSMQELQRRTERFLDEKAGEMTAFSDFLGHHPELPAEEFESSRRFVEVLRENGFEVEFPFLGIETAFMAKKRRGEGGVVALLAEYDALPEIGHACGHSLHGTLSLYAGLALGQAVEETGGEAWVVGTPAEEADGAKSPMADAGVFDGVDLAMMVHASGGTTWTDYRSLALHGYDITFRGKTAHAAAAPWDGRNALNGAKLFLVAMDMLRQQARPETRMYGIITNGGSAVNVIPDRAACRVEVRAPEKSGLDELMAQVFDCARGAAIATGTSVEWEKYLQSFDDMRPNPAAEALVKEMLEAQGFPCSPGPGAMGSTDVGNVSYRCPAIQPMMAITERPLALHTREFAEATFTPEAHDALLRGAKALAATGLRVLSDPALRERIRADFLIRDRH